jgi:tetratricopeptide (TPR) repeat protein
LGLPRILMKRVLVLLIAIIFAAAGGYATWNWIQQERENTWQVAMAKALAAHSANRDSEAEETLRNVLPDTEKWWPQGPHLIETLSWLGTIERVELKHAEAEPVLKRAIELAEQQGSAGTIVVGRAKLNLGIILRDQSDDVAAHKYFSEAAEILSKDPRAAWGDDDAALLNLGFMADKEGRYQEAVSYLMRAVSGYDALFGLTLNLDMANAHAHLGDVYSHLDNYPDAAEQYQAALKVYEQIEGPQGKDVRNILTSLATVQQGTAIVSRTQLDRSLDTSKNPADNDGTSLNNLGVLAQEQKEYAKAEGFFQRSCTAYEKSGGPNNVDMATALENLGNLYRDQPQFDMRKAEPILKRALAIREKMLGAEHPETAKLLSDLSLLYFYEKNPAAAEEFAHRALPLEEKAFGAESLPVSTTLNRLGISERDSGKFREAEANLKHALAIREEKRAPASWIVISLENLASVYIVQGERDKAMPLIARAQAIRAHSSSN